MLIGLDIDSTFTIRVTIHVTGWPLSYLDKPLIQFFMMGFSSSVSMKLVARNFLMEIYNQIPMSFMITTVINSLSTRD